MLMNRLLLLPITAFAACAVHAQKYLPLQETEYFVRGKYSEVALKTRYQYDENGRITVRQNFNEGVVDSITYEYDHLGRVVASQDYRGAQSGSLILYTDDTYDYDEVLRDTCVLHIGLNSVDGEWLRYVATKTRIDRDEQGRITRIADYTPADESTPDIPNSYVKTLTYEGDRLAGFLHQNYMYDPVTEEAYLQKYQEWTNIQWEACDNQVMDINKCFSGKNRIKSAHVYDDYYGYEYDLTVDYQPDGSYVATTLVSGGMLVKTNTVTMLDTYGSASEVVRTYRVENGERLLTMVESATDRYDAHGNHTMHEVAITADRDNPETLSRRMGRKWEYHYDATYGDWTSCDHFLFSQSYEEGIDGEYEQVAKIERSEWKALDEILAGVASPAQPTSKGADCMARDLQGRALAGTPSAKGIILKQGQKILR